MPRLSPGRRSGDHKAVHVTPVHERGASSENGAQLGRVPAFVIAYGFDAQSPSPVLRWTSEGMRTILGYGASALGPGWLMDAVHPDDVVMVVARHRDALGGRIETVDARFITTEGETRHLRGELAPADPDDLSRGGIAHWVDATPERAARELLARREEELWGARRLAVVGELAGGIAHDCGNLLTAIRAYSDLLKADLRETKHREDLDAISRSADNASALVRQLLTLGRAGSPQPRLLSLDELVATFERVLLRLLGPRHTLRVDVGQAGFVHADPAMIEHVLLNLVISARDELTDGGEIAIATDRAVMEMPFAYAGGVIAPGPYPEVRVRFDAGRTSGEVIASAAEAVDLDRTDTADAIGVATAAAMVRRAGGHFIAERERDGSCVLRMLFSSCIVAPDPSRGGGGRRARKSSGTPDITPSGDSAA